MGKGIRLGRRYFLSMNIFDMEKKFYLLVKVLIL